MNNVQPQIPTDVASVDMLLASLASGNIVDAPLFWQTAHAVNFPLQRIRPGSCLDCQVIFVWRSAKPLQGVYVRLNRVTDKHETEKGMMTQIPQSDVWWLMLNLPATYRGSYTIVEIPQGTDTKSIAELGSRFAPITGLPDPMNKSPGINVRGFDESILALDHAPAQPEWQFEKITPKGKMITYRQLLAGQYRRVRLYLPATSASTPLGLLVLPDAETWFDNVGIIPAIDAAISSCRISPLAVLGIDNINESDRNTILGGHTALVNDIARYIPQLRADNPQRVWAGRENTVIAGQSLGGITAIMAAIHASDIFGKVISHSASMWWRPDNSLRPFQFGENDFCWVNECLVAHPPATVKIKLCVGSLEGATVGHLQSMNVLLRNAGVESDLSVYTGGHDYAWWRGALIDGLVC